MNHKINILIFTPVWQRRAIFEICLHGIKRLVKYRTDVFKITPFFIVSESWAAKKIMSHNWPFIFVQNKPLGNKKNEGLSYVLQNYDFDYLLEIGSDDLISNNYLDLVLPYLQKNELQLCADSLYFIDSRTGDTAYFKTTNIFGLGRFIHRTALERVVKKNTLWKPDGNRGMDGYSWRTLMGAGIGLIKVHVEIPCLLDIKSDENINSMDALSYSYLNADELLRYFPERRQIKALINNE